MDDGDMHHHNTDLSSVISTMNPAVLSPISFQDSPTC